MKSTGMVDISGKKTTCREAIAQAFVELDKGIIEKIRSNRIPKGNVLENARIAGIFAAKRVSELIPLCHNINLECVKVDFKIEKNGVRIRALVKADYKTGVEMEALTAASVAALTIYDMCKMFSRSIKITDILLLKKTGGKSDYK